MSGGNECPSGETVSGSETEGCGSQGPPPKIQPVPSPAPPPSEGVPPKSKRNPSD